MRHAGAWWVLAPFLAIAVFFLATEHRAHVWGVAPYLLLLACPLLHFFVHRGHGRHGRDGGPGGDAGPPAGRPPERAAPAAGPEVRRP